jgi:hypothetical protein
MANIAQGRPNWNLYNGIISVMVIPLSFYIAAGYGLNALVIPWITIMPILKFGFTFFCLKEFHISMFEYLDNLKHPAIATGVMVILLELFRHLYIKFLSTLGFPLTLFLSVSVIIGIVSYCIYLLLFQRSIVMSVVNLRRV